MSLKNIKALSATITAKTAELQRLEADANRCREAIGKGAGHADTITTLRKQRDEAKGTAFLARKKISTADLDAKIEEAERLHADALRDAEAATAALAMLDRQIAAAHAELEDLSAKRQKAALDYCESAFTDAEAQYAAALQTLGAATARIVGTALVFDQITPDRRISSSAQQYIRINISEGLAGTRREGHQRPAWLSQRALGHADAQGLRSELIAAGIDFGDARQATDEAA